jgi:quercetin dioxygenase-like cupin family protein
MPNTVRRVVTGNDARGTAVISSDSRVASHPGKRGDVHVTDLWMTDGSPPTLNGDDPLGSIPVLPVPKGATFRIMEIGPDTAPHMHYTGTLDYIIVLEGVLEMALGDGTKVTMKEGDFMVQRGTVHGWMNPTDQPTRFATVILDAGGGFFEA